MNIRIYLKVISFATVMALIYIHMQMKIFELAYKGKDKEKEIHELADTNGMLTHQILTLKSANHLGNELLEKESDLQFMGKDHVMTMQAPPRPIRQIQMPKEHNENPLMHLLSFLGAQEAKAWEQ
jgi:hypothetical protein